MYNIVHIANVCIIIFIQGYYERGVAKLKAGHGRGIHDLNKSLAIDPALFQAFLARAAHYGRTGRYSKAILNCNEAIRIVPNSVRAYVYRYMYIN